MLAGLLPTETIVGGSRRPNLWHGQQDLNLPKTRAEILLNQIVQ